MITIVLLFAKLLVAIFVATKVFLVTAAGIFSGAFIRSWRELRSIRAAHPHDSSETSGSTAQPLRHTDIYDHKSTRAGNDLAGPLAGHGRGV